MVLLIESRLVSDPSQSVKVVMLFHCFLAVANIRSLKLTGIASRGPSPRNVNLGLCHLYVKHPQSLSHISLCQRIVTVLNCFILNYQGDGFG